MRGREWWAAIWLLAATGCGSEPGGQLGVPRQQPARACAFAAPEDPARNVMAAVTGRELVLIRTDGSRTAVHRFRDPPPILGERPYESAVLASQDGWLAATFSYRQLYAAYGQEARSYAVVLSPAGELAWSGEVDRAPLLGAGGQFVVEQPFQSTRVVAGAASFAAPDFTAIAGPRADGEVAGWFTDGEPGLVWLDPATGRRTRFAADPASGWPTPVALAGRMLYLGERGGEPRLVWEAPGDALEVALPQGAAAAVRDVTASGWVLLAVGDKWLRAHFPSGLLEALEVTLPEGQRVLGPAPRLADDGRLCVGLRDEASAGLYCSADGASWSRVGASFAQVSAVDAERAGATHVIRATDYRYTYLSPEDEWPSAAPSALLGRSLQVVRGELERVLPAEARVTPELLTADGLCVGFTVRKVTASATSITLLALDVEPGDSHELLVTDNLKAAAWIDPAR